MKKFATWYVLGLFFCYSASAQTFPVEDIVVNGSNSKRINFVYLSDGYQNSELNTYVSKVTTINSALFSQSPFLEYASFFNVYAIKVPSTQSGAKHAGTATDVSEPASPVQDPANYFGSRFDVSNIHRLLVPNSTAQALAVVNSNVPEYDQVMVLVNDPEYGGSGGTLATSSTNASANEIMYHEIGHSFANLADEYWFNCAERKNRTANNNANTIIWKNWLNTNGVGIFAYGTSGAPASCFRPHQNCKMRFLGAPYCSVCKEAFIDRIYQLVSPIEAFEPASNNVNFSGNSMTFSMTLILPNPNTLLIEWVLNGTVIATSGSSINITSAQLNAGSNTLQAKVTDGTLLSRSYWPASSGYLHSVTWTIEQALPVELLQFDAKIVDNQTELSWQTATEKNANYFDVEKSEDGVLFKSIGRVKAAGNSNVPLNYEYIDLSPRYGATYYRLSQVDVDGTTTLSPIRVVSRIDKIRYELFPNPANEVLHVQLNTLVTDAIILIIRDINGRIVFEQNYEPTESLSVEIPIQTLPVGQYMLSFHVGSNQIIKAFEKI